MEDEMDFEFWYQIWCRMEEKLEFVVEIWNEIRDLEMKLGIWYKIGKIWVSHPCDLYAHSHTNLSRKDLEKK